MLKYSSLRIKGICTLGLVLRILMLLLVTVFSKELSTGLLGSDYVQDDVRYLAGAEIYASTASGLIDNEAIIAAYDEVEPMGSHDSGLELWYWIISISMYLFRSAFLVRLLNIIFAVVSIKCIYDICLIQYNRKVAILASLLYAVLPYPIIFSCFLYKDQFYTMITLLVFRKAFECAGNIRPKDWIYLLVGILLSQLTRSGVSVVIFLSVIIILYKKGNYKVNSLWVIAGGVIFAAAMYFFVLLNLEDITRKLYAYILSNADAGESTIAMFEIRSPGQLYRYPFSYLFALVQPLNINFSLKNWFQMAGILNVVALPVAIANFYYLLNFKFKKDYLYWITQVLFLITILASLGIVRHQYYLQPFIMIYGAMYICNNKRLTFWKVSSISSIIIILMVWMFF